MAAVAWPALESLEHPHPAKEEWNRMVTLWLDGVAAGINRQPIDMLSAPRGCGL